jgi:hypothetical protein
MKRMGAVESGAWGDAARSAIAALAAARAVEATSDTTTNRQPETIECDKHDKVYRGPKPCPYCRRGDDKGARP